MSPKRLRIATTAESSNPSPPQETPPATGDGNSESTLLDYEFFMSTGQPEAVAGSSRKALRSHVMRNFFQQRSLSLEHQSLRSSASTVEAQRRLKGRFRLGKVTSAAGEFPEGLTPLSPAARPFSSSQEQSTSEQTPASIREHEEASEAQIYDRSYTPTLPTPQTLGNSMDPFHNLPVASNSRTQMIIYYWQTCFQLNSIAINIKPGAWALFATNDAGVLHSTLSSVSMYCSLFQGIPTTVDVQYHKCEAISLVNQQLMHTNSIIPDGLLGTISSLASFENNFGEYETSSTYLVGLRRLIEMRGGLSALSHNDALQRSIMWSEFHLAAAWRTRPYFEFRPSFSTSSLPEELLVEASSSTSLHAISSNRTYSEGLNDVYTSLKELALAFEWEGNSNIDRPLLSNMLNEAETKLGLFMTYFDESRLTESLIGASILDALIAGAYIFLYGAIRKVPIPLKIFGIFLSRLTAALNRANLEFAWATESSAEALLWVSFIGSIAASKTMEMPWFMERVASIIRVLRIQNMTHFQGILKTFPWTNEFCSSHSHSLWKSVVISN